MRFRFPARLHLPLQFAMALLGLLSSFSCSVHWSNNVYIEQVTVEPLGTLLPVSASDERIARVGPSPRLPSPPASEEPEWVESPFADPAITGTVFVLSQEYAWVRGERGDAAGDSRIDYHGERHKLSLIDRYLTSPGLQEHLRQASDVIAVGLASCEGSFAEEGRRAAARAEALAARLRAVYPPGRALGSLQLWEWSWGRFGTECPGARPEETRGQRRIVIVALRRGPGVALRAEDLHAAMEGSPALRVRPSDYPAPGPLLRVHH